MKRGTLAIAIAFVACISAMKLSAQSIEDLVLAANDLNNQALVAGDTRALGTVLEKSFISTGGAVILTRDQILSSLKSGDLSFHQVTASDRTVTINDDQTVTLTGTKTQIGTYKGVDISGVYPFTSTYVSTPSGWAATVSVVGVGCTRPPNQ